MSRDQPQRERVSSSLKSLPFLMQLRQPNTKGLLWVDAICISQHDGKEKSEKVSMMSSIYSEAEKVPVWVGGAPDDSDECSTFCIIHFVFGLPNLYILCIWEVH